MAPGLRTSEVSLGFYQLASLAESSNRKKKIAVNSDFVGGNSEESSSELSIFRRLQQMASKCLRSVLFINFIVMMVVVDAICTCRDIDARAKGEQTPTVFLVISNVCLGIYTLEFFLHLAVGGFGILTDWAVLLDILVILSGIAELVVSAAVPDDPLSGMNVVRALRLGRIL